MKNINFLLFLICISIAIFLLSGCKINKNNPKLSQEQNKVEMQVGEGIIHLKDLYLNFEQDVDFGDKQASIVHDGKIISYQIKDVLQPFDLDNQDDKEYPFLLEADYADGKKLDYLVIARMQDQKFVSVDQVIVGNPDKIDDIHPLDSNEVVIDAHVNGANGKESVILSYKFQDNKIVPDAKNIDIDNYKPAPPQAAKDDSKSNPANSGTKGKVALTFDDGPGVHTPEILDVLKNEGVKATFFEIGQNVESRKSYTQRIHEEEHLIGNHTYDHKDLSKLSFDSQMDEISHTNDIINSAIGAKPHYFRPPYGNTNDDTAKVLSSLGMEKVLWNIDTRDWSGLSADEIKQRALAGVKDGAIILMHDGVANSSETAKALPGIIETIKSRGYKMVKIDEM